MSEDLDQLEDLERQLREAHAFAPRHGLQAEIRSELRPPGRQVPWAPFSAAAAVLIAVAGVGFLLAHAPRGGLGTGAASTALRPAVMSFGKLPRPPLYASGRSAAGAASSASSGTPTTNSGTVPVAPQPFDQKVAIPASAPVYAWSGTTPCREAPAATLGGYPLFGPSDCHLGGPLRSSIYRLASPPVGAALVYVAVRDGSNGYFEPVYLLSDGTTETALTPDELRP